jgi:hypothetical protein
LFASLSFFRVSSEAFRPMLLSRSFSITCFGLFLPRLDAAIFSRRSGSAE